MLIDRHGDEVLTGSDDPAPDYELQCARAVQLNRPVDRYFNAKARTKTPVISGKTHTGPAHVDCLPETALWLPAASRVAKGAVELVSLGVSTIG
jgi:hypothetical protein